MAAIVAATLAAGGASAATVVVDGLSGEYIEDQNYVEDGVTVTNDGGPWLSFHLDIGGGPYTAYLTFTMATAFDALAFDLRPNTSAFQVCHEDADGVPICDGYDFDNYQVTGYSDGELVAIRTFSTASDKGTYTLGSDFTALDSLVFGFTPLPFGDAPEGYYCYCTDSPCTHYSLQPHQHHLGTNRSRSPPR